MDPTLFPDSDTQAPVAVGDDGILVLTTLHPFQITQPFLRYEVGDAVAWLGRFEEEFGGPAIRFRERASGSPILLPSMANSLRRKVFEAADVESA